MTQRVQIRAATGPQEVWASAGTTAGTGGSKGRAEVAALGCALGRAHVVHKPVVEDPHLKTKSWGRGLDTVSASMTSASASGGLDGYAGDGQTTSKTDWRRCRLSRPPPCFYKIISTAAKTPNLHRISNPPPSDAQRSQDVEPARVQWVRGWHAGGRNQLQGQLKGGP